MTPTAMAAQLGLVTAIRIDEKGRRVYRFSQVFGGPPLFTAVGRNNADSWLSGFAAGQRFEVVQ